MNLVGLQGGFKVGGRENTDGALNKVTKVVKVFRETCLSGRGWRLDVGLSGEADGGGSGGEG